MPKLQVINLLQVPGGSDSQQVMLQVRFAEVNRREADGGGPQSVRAAHGLLRRGRRRSSLPRPIFDDEKAGGLVFSDFLNLFFFNRTHGIGGVLKALQSTGGFQSLAEPNLIAYNGQEASFLAGGEFPIPVVQGATGTVTVVFKEFGIRLNFKPTIAGDVIRLKVRPEVSSLDFANGVTLSGFRIPALTTRRAETDVELRDGQSFAIAGLMNNISQNDAAAIPLLSKLPIIGYLFKSNAEARRTDRTDGARSRRAWSVRSNPTKCRRCRPIRACSSTRTKVPAVAAGMSEKLDGGAGLVDAPRPGIANKAKR